MLAKTFLLGLLASIPLATALEAREAGLQEREYTGSLAARAIAAIAEIERRHHTEAQIAAKAAAAKKKGNAKREAEAQEADEFGPWDTTEDEFGSWVDKRDPHHTEAQIAAKAAAAKKKGTNKREAEAQEADEFGPWDTTEDEFGSWVDKRDPHHTEAQIAAKAAAAKKKGTNKREADPEAHHTEAQIAAKQAAAAKTNCKREADPEAHHTEAQIAAKNAAASSSGGC